MWGVLEIQLVLRDQANRREDETKFSSDSHRLVWETSPASVGWGGFGGAGA